MKVRDLLKQLLTDGWYLDRSAAAPTKSSKQSRSGETRSPTQEPPF